MSGFWRGAGVPAGDRVSTFIECGCCGAYHRTDFDGDCREDSERFSDVPEGGIVVERREDMEPRSWAPEVIADNSGKWCGNGLRFTRREDAEEWVRDLSFRWTLVRETRVVASDDSPNR